MQCNRCHETGMMYEDDRYVPCEAAGCLYGPAARLGWDTAVQTAVDVAAEVLVRLRKKENQHEAPEQGVREVLVELCRMVAGGDDEHLDL